MKKSQRQKKVGNKMATFNLGDTFTTSKSGYVGGITDVIERNGRTVLELDGSRYTTV